MTTMIPGQYELLNTINATEDISNILVYANALTGGYLMPLVLASFFLILWIGGAIAQYRFTGKLSFNFSFAAAGFSTFGFAMIMAMKPGLIAPMWIFMSLGLTIAGILWIWLSPDNN